MADDGSLAALGVAETADRPADKPRRRRRLVKVLVLLLAIGLVLTGGLVGTLYYTSERLAGQTQRLPDVFTMPDDQRPVPPSPGQAGDKAMNILLAGSDRRAAGPTTGNTVSSGAEWVPGLQRSDTMMVLHLTADRRAAYLVSIPRDSWVDIPGKGRNKLNAAFSLGGPSLYVQTVEKLTGLRIDHLAVIDWQGFRQLTDALGGVTLDVATDDGSVQKTMNGEQALTYVRERYNLPGGDFDRIKRQQHFLRALMQQTLARDTLSNPVKLTRALDAVTKNLTVDEEFTSGEMRDLALSARNLRGQGVSFLTAPVRGTGREGKQSVVYLDTGRSRGLWQAVRSDDLPTWLAANPKSKLGTAVR